LSRLTHSGSAWSKHHPAVGDLELDYAVMELSADSGLLLAVFSAEPGSRSAEALDLLASWTATPEPVEAPSEAQGIER
jgi:MmyB-like transcription regulator ligand binding domain